MPLLYGPARGKAPMNGKYVGYVAGEDPLHGFLSMIMRDRLEVREPHLAFRVFRLSGSNEVYAYEEKFSSAKVICKFYGTRFGTDLDRAAWMARQEYEGLETLRRYNLVGSPHHVIRPLGLSRDINGVLAVEYFSGEEFSQAIARATQHRDDAHLYWRLKALAYFLATQHNRTANGATVDFDPECRYFDTLVGRLKKAHRIGQRDIGELSGLRDRWRERPRMWQDRMFDVGRVAGELQHAFMRDCGDRRRAEPFIRHFLWEYSRHFPDREQTFESISARAPYYMALNLLRIARNGYIGQDYGRRLVKQAKRLLQAA